MQKHLTVAGATAALTSTARDLIRLSMRDNTQRAYRAQLRQWLAWCEREGVEALPANPVHVANHIAERGSAGQSPSTLRTVVAAIKTATTSDLARRSCAASTRATRSVAGCTRSRSPRS